MAIFKKKTEEKKEEKKTVSKKQEDKKQVKATPETALKAHITEKALGLAQQNTYVFKAPRSLSKIEAAKQIEKLYKVDCIRVRSVAGTQKTRSWKGKTGRTEGYKKIFVTLKEGQKIEVTGQS